MAISDDGMSSSESVGFFSQIGDSIKGILIGMVLVPASFFTIFKVETCTQASDVFKKAKPVAQAEAGLPVYVTGKLDASPVSSRFVASGKYIKVSHSSEVCAWDEEKKTEGTGSKKKEITDCKLEWTSKPDNPSSFKLDACKRKAFHKREIEDFSDVADNGSISAGGKKYSVSLKDVKFTSAVKSGMPDSASLITNGYKLSGDHLYSKASCDSSCSGKSSPNEGCERISVSVTPIPSEDMTFLGDAKGDTLSPFVKGDDKFFSASLGTYETAMADIKSDDKMMLWIGRLIAFIMMWAGFSMMSGPLLTLLEFIPFVGDFGAGAIKFVLGVVAFILTAITIILVKFWYVWLIIIVGGIGFAIYKRNQAKAQAQAV